MTKTNQKYLKVEEQKSFHFLSSSLSLALKNLEKSIFFNLSLIDFSCQSLESLSRTRLVLVLFWKFESYDQLLKLLSKELLWTANNCICNWSHFRPNSYNFPSFDFTSFQSSLFLSIKKDLSDQTMWLYSLGSKFASMNGLLRCNYQDSIGELRPTKLNSSLVLLGLWFFLFLQEIQSNIERLLRRLEVLGSLDFLSRLGFTLFITGFRCDPFSQYSQTYTNYYSIYIQQLANDFEILFSTQMLGLKQRITDVLKLSNLQRSAQSIYTIRPLTILLFDNLFIYKADSLCYLKFAFLTVSQLILQLMTDYPLSTISSKKVKKSSHELLQKSACQIQLPPPPQKALYEHILKDEKLFIQLYYQGKILETAYNQYVEFMGGVLYKRLNPRVTIFLTNTEDAELGNILERVKRVCPQCKVVSILWFEQSYQNKCKLPLDNYLLHKTAKSKEKTQVSKEQVKIQSFQLEPFLDNIGEDIEHQYQQFFKKKEQKPFYYLQKNQTSEKFSVIESKEYDLGPHPNKKKAVKPDSFDKKQKKNYRATAKFTIDKDNLEVIETKSQKSKNSPQKQPIFQKKAQLFTEINHQDYINIKNATVINVDQTVKDIPKPQQHQNLDFNAMMERYLKNAGSSDQSMRPRLISNTSTQGASNSSKTSLLDKRSVHTQRNTDQKIEGPTITPKYKDVKYVEQKHLKDQMLEVDLLKLQLAEEAQNRIVVVSTSKSLLSKVEECNKLSQKNMFLYFKYIDYYTYWTLLQSSPPQHKAYFPLNEARPIDRPLYFALKSNFANCPKLISSNVVKQVMAFNNKLKEKQNGQIELERLPFLREMNFPVCNTVIKNKKVTFMQSELSNQINKLIVDLMGGYWVSVQNFMNTKVDVVVTSRNHLKKKDCTYFTEQQLWNLLFPFKIGLHTPLKYK